MSHHEDLNEEPIERRLALLADKTLQGLDDREAAELLEIEPLAGMDSLELELAAATVARLDIGDSPALPDWLAAKIEHDAKVHFPSNPPESLRFPVARSPFFQQLGWWVAAASIAFALMNFPRPIPDKKPPVDSIEAELGRSPAASFVNTNHPLGLGAAGRVVWNTATQKGYLALEGLAPNDLRKGIYQLWIFDGDRDKRYPVDGGVFSIDKKFKTTIVPIRPGIEVKKPTLFAVTLEPPGGVVVSDRQRLLLTATWNDDDLSKRGAAAPSFQ